MTRQPYDSSEDFIQQKITEHEVKKAALLAIKQEAEKRKASEKAAREAQEAAQEAENAKADTELE